MEKRLNIELDCGMLIEELRTRLARSHNNGGREDYRVKEQIRSRLAFLLDVDPATSLAEVIEHLAEKWQHDGLI